MSSTLHYFRSVITGQRRGTIPTLLRWGMTALTLPYAVGASVRNFAFDRGWKQIHRAQVPVISVGNLTVGGTGKTPCVEWIARFFRQRDVRVTILSRGYGASDGPNDEALVLEENLPDVPHLQGADRAALAAIAVEELESELLILDDGFQHRRLARDLDVVLLDATDPWGQGHLLPRGFLRESARSLERANVIVVTRTDQITEQAREQLRHQCQKLAPSVPIVETVHRPVDARNSEQERSKLDEFAGRRIAAFCGIGNPEGFQQTLRELGVEGRAFRAFADHHGYGREDVEDVTTWADQQDVDSVVTTQKDLVKLCIPRLGAKPLWALSIRLDGLQQDSMIHFEELLTLFHREKLLTALTEAG